MQQADWRVGAILNETLADTLRFAAWYLAEGASALQLYFDNPEDRAIAILGDHPRIDCVPCRPEIWADLGMAPDARFVKRQNAAMSAAYRAATEPWFLNVDADEFLHVEGRSIGALLAEQAAETEAVRITTAEIVGTVAPSGKTQFRLPMQRDAAKRVYRDNAYVFGPRRMGLIGHPQGKSVTRTGIAGAIVRQHWVERADRSRVNERVLGPEAGCYLLHVIGQDYDTWRAKLDWRSASRGFTVPLTERIAAAMAGPDPEARLRAFHAIMHHMDAATLDRLDAEGARLQLSLDLDARVRDIFGSGHV